MPSHSTTPDWSPTVQVNITHLMEDAQGDQTVRARRWPDGLTCPACASQHLIKRGVDDTDPARQRDACHDGDQRGDELTDTMFAGQHQPLHVWVWCRYFLGRNVSSAPSGQALARNGRAVPPMTAQLRDG